MLNEMITIKEMLLFLTIVGLIAYFVGHKFGKKDAQKEFVVNVTPFYRSEKKSILPWKDELVEIGYSYQLFVKGFPCLFPFERVETKKRTSELDQVKFMQLVEGVARNAVTHTSPVGLAINFMKPENRTKS